jgi:hypothetical protein
MSPTKEFLQVFLIGDSALAVGYEHKPQVPAGMLKDTKCKKGTLLIRLSIPYVPPSDLHELQEMEQIKVKLPNRTLFQMPTYRSGNN